MAAISGKNGKVVYGSTTLCVRSWKGSHVAAFLDGTSTCSGGKREFVPGLEHFEFTIEADWDATTHPFGTTPANLKANQTVNVDLYVDASTSNPTVDMPTAAIEKVDIDSSVEGLVKYTISGKSSGSFTLQG